MSLPYNVGQIANMLIIDKSQGACNITLAFTAL